MTTKIEFTNIKQVLAGMEARKDIGPIIKKTGDQMGVLALNEIHQRTPKKTMALDSSYHARVQRIGTMKFELWVGSKGAFSKSGYNYVPIQEYKYRPHLRPGWHAAIPAMQDAWQRNITLGIAGRAILGRVGLPDEFGALAGMMM